MLDGLLNKCTTLRTLKRVGACVQIFVADHFSTRAFELAKRTGVIPATPENLFGKDVGEGLIRLFDVLHSAAQFSLDPDVFNQLFEKLSHIEGIAVNLRGALFEYLVAEMVRRRSNSSLVRLARTYKLPNGEMAEADIVSEVPNLAVTFIECKGYQPAGMIPDEYIERWLTKTIPRLYEYARSHPDWKSLKIEFELWTTGRLTDEAREKVESLSQQVRPTKYTVNVLNADGIRELAKSLKDGALLKVFNEHFIDHPLASLQRKRKHQRVRIPMSLAKAPEEHAPAIQQLPEELPTHNITEDPPF